MARQYSDSNPPSRALFPALVVDSGSPVVSVAFDPGHEAPVVRSLRQRQSSGSLLRLVQETMDETGAAPRDLRSLIGLRGPGSFTGLRVGLSMLLGLQEALEIPATGISTLDTLASWSSGFFSDGHDPEGTGSGIAVAAVDALRGEWFLQPYRIQSGGVTAPIAGPRCLPAANLVDLATDEAPRAVVGFGARQLASEVELAQDWTVAEPDSLAGAACALIRSRDLVWDVELLCDPLYLRPPAVRRPG